MTTIIAERLFDGEKFQQNVAVTFEGDKIVSVGGDAPADAVKVAGTVAPGLIDIQVNGGGGKLLNSDTNVEALEIMMKAHGQFGTTAMLPTLITDRIDVIRNAADAIAAAIEKGVPGIIGVHFEGPHLSIPKRGAHATEYIRELSADEMAVYTRKDLGIVKVTVAPENVTPAQIKELVDNGVIVFLGHTNTDFDTTMKAIEAGASGFTHLYNAMSPMTSREPGVTGAALLSDAYCGIIIDGHHVHAGSAKVAIKAKPGKIILVSDSMPPVGTTETHFVLANEKVTREGSKLTNESGALAGSVLDMIGAVKNTVETLDVSLEEALRMASQYAADCIGLGDQLGAIAPGKQADFIVFNDQYEVTASWIAGQQQF
ncbi:N-acetylglucosamine-6-phosphate deacetylase [Catenovulum sp. SM1970]|uniref:N-acetylglucosamine-6-phosphate deacetylase n=1 Tax=Marinifaba aquimaris TaxID=2741323 RepID=UPI00157416A7|nr:N-acetylglucosamine-6-phosphate deacetylase [Marinifaba aquimaris]NTS76616.1 N-acetylglucosamine-6-phosphate deacetylase [Marinifaba aquimaris]